MAAAGAGSIDFGDGGAFPELHVSQYPLGMGRPGKTSNAVALSTDGAGNVQSMELVRQGQREGKVIYSKYSDLLPKEYDDDDLARPTQDDVAELTEKTRQALEAVTQTKITGNRPLGDGFEAAAAAGRTSYFNYTPAPTQGGMQTCGTRMVQVVELPKDPLEPPKFRVKRAPGGPPSPPVPVMHSPPRKLTMRDMQDWKVPPCISNWKNPKGYTIPLDKRLAADGRGLQEVQINDNFAKLAESLYIAERQAREEVDKRVQVNKKIQLRDKERREAELREMAMQAREEKQRLSSLHGPAGDGGADAETAEEAASRRQRDEARDQRRRDWEHARLLAERKASGRGGADREMERDLHEQMALRPGGGAQPTRDAAAFYDQRMFNQEDARSSLAGGLDGAEDGAAYSKPLLGGGKKRGIFRADRKALEEEHQKQAAGAGREPAKAIEFERDAAEDDPFGLFDILKEAAPPPAKRGRTDADSPRRDRDRDRDRRRRDR